MIMVVDIGNTNIEYGIFENDELIVKFRQSVNKLLTSDEIGLSICQFFLINDIATEQVEDVVICSVVPQIMHSFNNAIRKYFGKNPIIIGENLDYDFSPIYPNVREAGADRLVCCISALEKYGAPVVVVDFGTATTFDAINEDRKYIGGAIYPGIKISAEALTAKTAKLPDIEIKDPGTILAKDTVSQIQAGIVYGYTGVVKNILNELLINLLPQNYFISDSDLRNYVYQEKEINCLPVKIIATGGLSSIVEAKEHMFHIIDKTLILDGLNMLYKKHLANHKLS